MSIDEAERWLAPLLVDPRDGVSTFGQVGDLPAINADLERPKALIQVLPDIDSPASSLIAGLGRPARGLLWTRPEPVELSLPQMVETSSGTSFLPARDLVGIHVSPPTTDPAIATASGLLVARAERRAWLIETHGSGDFEHYIAELAWDPTRIDLGDLELTHVERLGKETVHSTRIRLEDLDLSAVRTAERCSVRLPTIGRSVTHEVLLHTLDGDLLDRAGPYPILEKIITTFSIDGAPPGPPVVHGITDPPPGLDIRLERTEQIERDIRQVLQDGAQARMIADEQTALDRLAEHLRTARGELMVHDLYFGQSLSDWRLLDSINIPVRVLTGKLESDPESKSVLPAPIGAHVEARYRKRAPMHERFYIWDGGGISVGGSPTTFGKAPVHIHRIRRADVDMCRDLFEGLWNSPLFQQVPRV